MDLSDYSKWRIANLQVMLFLVTGAIISIIPSRDVWFGFISDRGVNIFISVASGFWIHLITKRLVAAFDEYEPKTSLQAKRANEQIKLTANFSNAVSTATIAVLALSQLVGDKRPEYYKIIIGITIAAMIHAGGRNLVSLLKDEALGSTE